MIRKETNRNRKKVFGSHCLLVWGFFSPEVCKPVCHYRFNEYSLLLQVLKVLMRRPPLSTCLPLHLGFACFLLHVTVFPARKSWVQLPSSWFLSWQQPLCPQKDFGVGFLFPLLYQTSGILEKVVSCQCFQFWCKPGLSVRRGITGQKGKLMIMWPL